MKKTAHFHLSVQRLGMSADRLIRPEDFIEFPRTILILLRFLFVMVEPRYMGLDNSCLDSVVGTTLFSGLRGTARPQHNTS
jgi:hypothetical protein